MQEVVGKAIQRRNEIVHRGDRKRGSEEVQEMTLSYATQGVDTLRHVCIALDEVVTARLDLLRAESTGGSDGAR